MKPAKLTAVLTSLVMGTALLGGCGFLPVQAQAAEEAAAADEAASPETAEAISGNGGYFVLQGTELYFRSYPADSLDHSALGGNFLSAPTGRPSDMMVYHTLTGDTSYLFSDSGYGSISLLDGRFYMEGQETGEDGEPLCFIYSCLPDGTDVKRLPSDHSLFFSGLEEDTGTLVLKAYDEQGTISLELWQGDQQAAVLSDPDRNVFYVGAGSGYVLYAVGGSQDKQALYAYDLHKGESVSLGRLSGGEDKKGYDSFWDFAMEGTAFQIRAGKVEGSMSYLYEGAVLSGDAGKADSLKIDTVTDVSLFEDKPEEELYASIEETLDGIALTGDFDPEESFSCVELKEDLDHYTALVINDQTLDPDNSIGWRDSYARNGTFYVLVDRDTGEIVLMHEEDCLYPGTPQFQGPLVSDALTKQGTYQDDAGNTYEYSYFIPRFNADTEAARALNAEILEAFRDTVDKELSNMEDGLSLVCTSLVYQDFEMGDRASVLVTTSYEGDYTTCAAYTYDFTADKAVTNKELLESVGLTEEDFLARAADMTAEAFRERYPDAGAEGEKVLEEGRDLIRTDLPMYMDADGFFHAVLPVPSLAGADHYDQDFTF